jgi:hypothetical protein
MVPDRSPIDFEKITDMLERNSRVLFGAENRARMRALPSERRRRHELLIALQRGYDICQNRRFQFFGQSVWGRGRRVNVII